jgi:hypothetical protein
MKTIFNALLIAFLPLITGLHAETIYKITDEHGQITYTTTPPLDDANAKTIDVAPEPSDDRVKAAQERHKNNLKTGDIIDETNAERNRIAEEENRIKKERQNQMQQNRPDEESNDNQHYGYPYYPGRKPGYPAVRPPVNRPARPAR